MKKYTENENPIRFGIIYNEDARRTTETVWYKTEEQRTEAVLEIERSGFLHIEYNGSPIGKQVPIYAFTEIEAKRFYYTKNNT